jgi:precorrin-8X/cobalt-precorrin-8 methylmutase
VTRASDTVSTMNRVIHPIEQESFAILRGSLAARYPDAPVRPPLARAVLERIIHASADLEYAEDLVLPADAVLEKAVAALREGDGVPVVADVAMVAAGITRRRALCRIADPRAAELSKASGITRSAAALRLAATEAGPGAIYVVGCAPTALFELIERAETYQPLLVLGLPVGFVGAVESKQALRESGLPAVSNVSGKGGSAVAAAALNALLYWEPEAAA